MPFETSVEMHNMMNVDQSFNKMSQVTDMESEDTYLIDQKSVDYVFKDEIQSDTEDDLHEKSLLSNQGSECDTNASNLIDEIEFTDGFFKRDLLPMLSKGHEGELCQYLQEIGVLKSSMRCSTEGCDSHPMSWTPSRVVDKYQWVCNKCKKRKSIREHSFFKGIKFIIPIVLRAMQGWCGNYDSSDLAQSMGLKSYAFRTVYQACRDVAARHMTSLLSSELLGGPDTVVILEVWATGLKGAVVPIAGLIELKDKKFKYFYQPLRYNQQCLWDSQTQIEKNNNNIISENSNSHSHNKTNHNNQNAKRIKLDSNDSVSSMDSSDMMNTDTTSMNTNNNNNKQISSTKPKTSSRSRGPKDITGDLQSLIRQKVAANSFLVLGNGISSAVASSLLKTENMNAVKTLEMLKGVEKESNPLSDIIGLILQHPSDVISKAREIPRTQIQPFLMTRLWYDTYARQQDRERNSLETLLHQIASEDYYCVTTNTSSTSNMSNTSIEKDGNNSTSNTSGGGDFMSETMMRFAD